MSFDIDWDIEKHKLEYECDEHWELRKKFLETHKEKYPEDQLVCLAQVFTNVELLGCRYPKETMDLVAELSEDVAKDYRERQKDKLKRTFVKASDAASAKAKGQKIPHAGNASTSNNRNSRKRKRVDKRKDLIKRVRLVEQPFGNIVVLDYPNASPQCTIDSSVKMSGQKIEWRFMHKRSDEYQCRCEVYINNKKLSDGLGVGKKLAKAEAAKVGLIILQKYYYTIEVKEEWKSSLTGKQSELKLSNASNKSLSSDSVGAKLMKLMGWAGGGLGKSEQGITEPITLPRQISRRGFGLKLNSFNSDMFKKKCEETLMQYLDEDDTQNYLVFSDFSNEERAIMHETARKLGLKSQSHGQKNQRTLCVSRKIDPCDLVDELLKLGGHSDKYMLISPKNLSAK